VLRYLILKVEAVPAQELELTQAESAAGFVVPLPPEDVLEAEVEEELEEEPVEESAELEEAAAPAEELAEEEV
jgi:hypothetical protein